MPDTAWDKVEDALLAVLAATPGLSGWHIEVGDSTGIASDPADKTIRIWTTGQGMEQFEYDAQTLHTQTIDIEFIQTGVPIGILSRDIREAMADAHAALAADRTLGGRLQDLQETDIAPVPSEGRDASGSSVQYHVEFTTSRNNWRIIVGHGGALF